MLTRSRAPDFQNSKMFSARKPFFVIQHVSHRKKKRKKKYTYLPYLMFFQPLPEPHTYLFWPKFKLLNQFRTVTMIASTSLGTHNPRLSAQTVTNRLLEISENPPYTMYVLYAGFFFGLVYVSFLPSLVKSSR